MTRTITGANLRKAVASLIIALIGIAAVIGGFGYGFIEDGRIAAGFLPVLVGGAMAFFALLDVVGSVRSTEKETTLLETAQVEAPDTLLEPADSDDPDIYGRSAKQRDRMLLMVIGIILATVLLVPVLGFVVAFALMLIVIAVVVERRRLLPSILVSAIALAAAYGIFVLFLRVPLPTGILGI